MKYKKLVKEMYQRMSTTEVQFARRKEYPFDIVQWITMRELWSDFSCDPPIFEQEVIALVGKGESYLREHFFDLFEVDYDNQARKPMCFNRGMNCVLI